MVMPTQDSYQSCQAIIGISYSNRRLNVKYKKWILGIISIVKGDLSSPP